MSPRRLPSEYLAVTEAALLLAALRVVVRRSPFRRLASWCGLEPGDAATAPSDLSDQRAVAVGLAVQRAAARLPFQSTCLMQALAGARMLRRRGVAATVCLGVAKDAAEERGFAAHAWLRAGDVVLTGAAGSGRFRPVASYHVR